MFRWARFSRLGPAFDEFAASGDWAGAVRAAVGDDVPAGIALVSIGADGELSCAHRPAPAGRPRRDRPDRRGARLGPGRRPRPRRRGRRRRGAGAGRRGRAEDRRRRRPDHRHLRPGPVHDRRHRPGRRGDAAADQPARRTLVGDGRDRRGLVRRRRPRQVGRRRPAVLPHRSRPRGAARPGRPAARRRRPRARVRADGGRRRAGRGRDRGRRLRPGAALRPGRRGLVRRRPARPSQLQRRPRPGARRRRAHAARRGPRPDAPRSPATSVARSSTTRSCWRRRRARTCAPTERWCVRGWSSATSCSGTCTDSA